MSQLKLTRHPHGISAVDTDYVRPGLAAAHIIQQDGRAAFVDVGTTHSIPLLLTALDVLGVARDAVDYIFLTHVHLDHAGGAGNLLQLLPNAKVVLHPRGAPHLIEPSKLIAGSIAVYGDALYRQLYGEIVPLPAQRVLVTQDLQRIQLAGREFEFVHTPGHAMHHHCIVDLSHASIFTGDTFGLSYREFDTERGAFIIPTTTPTQFDPEQLVASIDRLLAYRPEAMYLMHFSRVTDVPRLGESLKMQVRRLADIARRHAEDGEGRKEAMAAEMRSMWHELLAEHGCKLDEAEIDAVLETDLELNAQGLVAWVDRLKSRGGAA
jgi:glyoxylase-like metal-dependent hydrolase (beta-lactamase superfamily II)